MTLYAQAPQAPSSMEDGGMADPGLFGTGIMHIGFLATIVLLLLVVGFLYFRRRATGSRNFESGKKPPDIESRP